jgi:hypothetical protein
MTQRANILQELNEIGSSLENASPENIYTVPVGYFEEFAEQILDVVKSTVLNVDSKKIPYSVPDNYFNGLEERLMQAVRESADYRTAKEELENISPLLRGLQKEKLYTVPQGYFENLNAEINKPKAKVVSFTHRKWFKYAAAAIVVGIISMSVFLFQGKKPSIDINKNPDAWVAKNVKKVNTDQLNEFINLADEESTPKTAINNKVDKPEDLKDLMKDVSDQEMQDFLKETSVLNDNSLLN